MQLCGGVLIENYTRVCLCTDRFRDKGVGCGALGYIIEVYDDGAYEVEFSDSNGATIAQVVAREEELEPNEPPVALPRAEAVRP